MSEPRRRPTDAVSGSQAPMRILLVTRFFPPSPEVGGLRPANLARMLRQRGHEVTIVTAAIPASPDVFAAPEFRAVVPHASLRDVLVRGKRAIRGTTPNERRAPAPVVRRSGEGSDSVDEIPRGLRANLRRLALSFAWLPDDHQGFILPAVRAILAELDRAPYDLIITTAPPFSVHVVGLIAQMLRGTPWVAEFRDPWRYEGRRPPHISSSVADTLESWLERNCLRRSDMVVAVTRRTAALLASHRHSMRRPSPVLALNGIQTIAADRGGTRRPGPVRVLHAGNVYGGRDPRPFLAALATLRDRGALPPDGVIVDFVGEADQFDHTSIPDMISSLGLSDLVRLRGRVPHHEALALQDDAEVLLLLAQRQPLQVPNKLFEYLGAKRPILAYVDADGESADMLREVGGHFLVTEQTTDEAAQLHGALHAPLGGWSPQHPEVLDAWRMDLQFAHLAEQLERKFGRRP